VTPFQDLVIAVTALESGYGVATHNLHHFRMMPDLAVTEL
jgi:predicted nucleic acid-binding protein